MTLSLVYHEINKYIGAHLLFPRSTQPIPSDPKVRQQLNPTQPLALSSKSQAKPNQTKPNQTSTMGLAVSVAGNRTKLPRPQSKKS